MASLRLPSCPLSEKQRSIHFFRVWVPDKLWSVETGSHGEGASWVLGAQRPLIPSWPVRVGVLSSRPTVGATGTDSEQMGTLT